VYCLALYTPRAGRTPPAGEGGCAAGSLPPLPLPQAWTCCAVQIATRVPLSLYLGPRLVNAVSLRKRPNSLFFVVQCKCVVTQGRVRTVCLPKVPAALLQLQLLLLVVAGQAACQLLDLHYDAHCQYSASLVSECLCNPRRFRAITHHSSHTSATSPPHASRLALAPQSSHSTPAARARAPRYVANVDPGLGGFGKGLGALLASPFAGGGGDN
jgi:hypothetical protein